MLNEDGTIFTEKKATVERCARFYKNLYTISRDVAATNYNLNTQKGKEPL